MKHTNGKNGVLARALSLLVCLVFAAAAAVPALADGVVAGTQVHVYAITAPFAITSKTEDFVLPVGDSEQLRAEASQPVKAWKWEVSTDGGKTWQTVSTGKTYDITDAKLNQDATGRDIPYQYRVTAENEFGETASATVNVLVSNDYSYRTIPVDQVAASAYMHKWTDLTVTPLGSGTTDAETFLRARVWDGYEAGIFCEASLDTIASNKDPYFGEVQMEFRVGTQYNAQTLRIFHYHNGEVEEYTAVVENGVVSIRVRELGAFLVEVPQPERYTITASAGKGGSISPKGAVQVPAKGEMYFYFFPDAGYRLAQVTVDGVPVEAADGSYHFTRVTADHTICAEFCAAPGEPGSGSGSSGSGSTSSTGSTSGGGSGAPGASTGGSAGNGPSGAGGSASSSAGNSGEPDSSRPNGAGSTAAGTDSTQPGGSGSSAAGTDGSGTTFRTITVNGSEHGTVSPSGVLQVANGGTLVLYFYPDDGYEIGSVTVNGAEVPIEGGQMTLPGITGDLDIRVKFTPIVPGTEPSGTGTPGNGTGGWTCHCLWYKLFGVCYLCRWFGRCIEPWCWLIPLILLILLILFLLSRRKKEDDTEDNEEPKEPPAE